MADRACLLRGRRRGPVPDPARAGFLRRAGALALLFMLAAAFTAQAEAPNVVVEISVEGETQVESGLILSNLASRVGDPLDRNKVSRDIKTIFQLGYFQDVSAFAEEVPNQGVRIMFQVKEKPRIGNLELTGVTLLTKQVVHDAVTVKIGAVYDSFAVDKTIENLREQYRKKGYFSVRIRSQLDKPSDAEYSLTIVVQETPKVFVTHITTSGNTVFSELQLQRFMQTAEVDCFDWINDSGVLDEQKINADLQAVSAR
jgi:outer membrane protein insertion porin family